MRGTAFILSSIRGHLKNCMRFYHEAFPTFLRRETSVQSRETFGFSS